MRRLLIRPGAIGDFVLSLPAMECLRDGYLEVWTAAAHVSLARFADRACSIASTGLDLVGVTGAEPRLLDRFRQFDSIISWYGSNRPEFQDEVRQYHLPFTFFPALPRDASGRHAADFYLDQARTLRPCDCEGVPRIACPPGRRDFAVIHPFSSSPRKNWPLEQFRRVADRLERRMPVRWCRGPEDPPLPGAMEFGDLYELACWLAGAGLYIGNDSGITHLAAAVGTPVLALFGPTDPAVWAPRGGNVRVARFGGAG